MKNNNKNNRNDHWNEVVDFALKEIIKVNNGFPEIGRPSLPVPPKQVFGSLPHPNGGWISWGVDADLRICQIVDDYLSCINDGNQIDPSSVYVAFRAEISDRFLKRKLEVSSKEINQAIDRAVKEAKKERKIITHWIPCHFVANHEPSLIKVGPVTFRRTSEFIQSQQDGFDIYIKDFAPNQVADNQSACKFNETECKKDRIHFIDVARKYYERFDWVAEITISNFSPSLSEERAHICVQAAMDIFRLSLGSPVGRNISAEGHRIRTVEGAKIIRMDNNKLDILLSRLPTTPMLDDNEWSQFVTNPAISEFFGSLLGTLTVSDAPPPLCQRLLDALNWFGQAVAETSPGAAVTKFVSAIERITQCEKKSKDGLVTKQFCDRAAALCVDPQNPDFNNWNAKFKSLYSLRSKITHGSISPLDPSIRREVQYAEKLTQQVITHAFDFFWKLGVHGTEWSPKKLNGEMDRFVQRVQQTYPPVSPLATPETGSKDP